MPGVFRLSVDVAVREAERAAKLGIPAIATFPNVDMALRDEAGSAILDPGNLINRATRAIKDAVPEIGVITDAALDPFTSHGHDGILRDGVIVNDESVAQVTAAAVLQAAAGADIVAPSDMMAASAPSATRSTRTASMTWRSWPTPPNSPPPSTAPIARRSAPRAS
jgi:porphobilinogen synthase